MGGREEEGNRSRTEEGRGDLLLYLSGSAQLAVCSDPDCLVGCWCIFRLAAGDGWPAGLEATEGGRSNRAWSGPLATHQSAHSILGPAARQFNDDIDAMGSGVYLWPNRT
jgi:hypothetical protein